MRLTLLFMFGLACLYGQGQPVFNQDTLHVEVRKYKDSATGINYLIKYEFYDRQFLKPNDTLPPHYPAYISVLQLDESICWGVELEAMGLYVPEPGCPEDTPKKWVGEAMEQLAKSIRRYK